MVEEKQITTTDDVNDEAGANDSEEWEQEFETEQDKGEENDFIKIFVDFLLQESQKWRKMWKGPLQNLST